MKKTQRYKSTALLFSALALIGGSALGILALNIPNLIYLLLGLAGIVVIAVFVFRIEWGLYALVLITFLNLSDVLIKFHKAPSIIKIFVPALLGLVLVRWLFFQEKPSKGWIGAGMLFTGYGLLIFSSLFYASNPERVLKGLEVYTKQIIIAILVVMLLRRAVTLRGVIWSLIAAGFFLGTITTYQALTGTFSNNYWGFAQPGEVTFGIGYRIAGPLNTNFYAMILVMLVPLALGRFWNEKSLILRVLAFWALMVFVISIMFTYSRGGFLALAVVLGLMFVRRPPRPIELLVMFVLGAGLMQFLPSGYMNRIMSLTWLSPSNAESLRSDSSLASRSSLSLAAWLMFIDHPLIGVGYENYENNYFQYAEEIGLEPRREEKGAHNLYLEIASETGILGVVVFGTILLFMFIGIHRAKHDFIKAELPYYAQLIGDFNIALIGYLTGSLFLQMMFPSYFWLLVGIALAIPYVAKNELVNFKTQAVTSHIIDLKHLLIRLRNTGYELNLIYQGKGDKSENGSFPGI